MDTGGGLQMGCALYWGPILSLPWEEVGNTYTSSLSFSNHVMHCLSSLVLGAQGQD